MVQIKLWNTASRTKELFEPLDPADVRIYACGPTVYDRAHLGNARPAVVFDVLARLMRLTYGADHVTYVRNITDVDDKINARAAQTGRPIREITEETVGWYLDDMGALGVIPPDHQPRATEYITQMIAMIEELIAKDHAYAAEGHALFRVRSYAEYGKLSGRSVDDMIAGARVEVAPYKEDPMDFVLWKPAGDGPGWPSPWGEGRPGWHIECSAMARELLGETFDIHAGGIDLQFPHHENEIAQSTCAHGAPMARYWLHNEMLQVEGKKMSKSLGNFFTVRDLLDQGYHGAVIRFVLLSTQYSKPMDWTEKKADEAKKALFDWARIIDGNITYEESGPDTDVLNAIADDLNTPLAISRLHALAKAARAGDEHAQKTFLPSLLLLGFEDLDQLVTINQPDEKVLPVFKELCARLTDLRATAMETKDFSKLDELKNKLLNAGVIVKMSKEGIGLERGPDFDATKLEGL